MTTYARLRKNVRPRSMLAAELLTVDENFGDVQFRVEEDEVGALADDETADVIRQPEDRGRGEGGHPDGGGEVDADLLVHVAEHVVHAPCAGGEAVAVHGESDFPVVVEGFAAVLWAE